MLFHYHMASSKFLLIYVWLLGELSTVASGYDMWVHTEAAAPGGRRIQISREQQDEEGDAPLGSTSSRVASGHHMRVAEATATVAADGRIQFVREQQDEVEDVERGDDDALSPVSLSIQNSESSSNDALLQFVHSLVDTSKGFTRRSGSSEPLIGSILHTMSPVQFPENFGSCALVGSSSTLSGAGHGAEIDAHDTVIRANRLLELNQTLQPDVGSRTDIFVDNTPFLFNPMLKKQKMLRPRAKPRKGPFHCMLQSGADEDGRRCPAKMIVIVQRIDYAYLPWGGGDREWIQDSVLPIGEITAAMHNATQEVANTWLGGHDVTGGFLSLLTLGPLCESISIYGFGGAQGQTIDNHGREPLSNHDFTGEHNALRGFVGGGFSPQSIESHLLREIFEALVSLAAAGKLALLQ